MGWCGYVFGQGKTGWVKGCMYCGLEGVGPGGRPGETWSGVVEDCRARQACKGDAVGRGRQGELIRDVVWLPQGEGVGE